METHEVLGIDEKVLSRPPKRNILRSVLQSCKKSAVKHFIEKPMLFNFMDLSTIFPARQYYNHIN